MVNTFTAKFKAKTKIMGFLLILFPQDNSTASAKSITRNASNSILSHTQSTISVCAFILFLTLLLFTLSTFDFQPTTHLINTTTTNRRFLLHNHKLPIHLNTRYKFRFLAPNHKTKTQLLPSFALQGMGRLYRRGTRAMTDLVIAHVPEDANQHQFRLFLRLLHRSGITARADVLFIFPSFVFASRFEALITEENEAFFKLLHRHKQFNGTNQHSVSAAISSFDATQFVKKEITHQSIWGNNKTITYTHEYGESGQNEDGLTRLSYGSVVGFEASELDTENSLAGFLDHRHVPMNLRRWACYPMLLGRVRRNFKHLLLVQATNSLILRDPLDRVRNQSTESVFVFKKQEVSSKSKRRNSERNQVNSAVLMGGTRGMRRLSNAMLIEIVRATMQGKKMTESEILSKLVRNEQVLKIINLMASSESIPDVGSISGSNSTSEITVIHGGNFNDNDINSIFMNHICSEELDFSVYRDC